MGRITLAHHIHTTPEYLETWREAAACKGTADVDSFGDPSQQRSISAARALCSRCPVAGECLTWAIETNQVDGIWGGHTPAERRSLRRRWLGTR